MISSAHAPLSKQEFIFPDYAGGSLLNLMQTLMSGFGLPGHGHAPLRPAFGLSPEDIASARSVVLVIIDGLGQNILDTHAPSGTIRQHQIGSLTSVYPSTTASAIPTFFTGMAPQAHGMTGWHMWFEEIGQTLAVLPLSPRSPGAEPGDGDWLVKQLLTPAPIAAQLAGHYYAIAPTEIVNSPFNRLFTDGAQRLAYRGLNGFIDAIEVAVKRCVAAPTPSLIHAYYPALDSLMHQIGTQDNRIHSRIQQIDDAFANLCERLVGSGVLILLTADHGFINAPSEHLISLDRHPEFAAMLRRPLCGERRLAYAYVAPEHHTAFQNYAAKHFSEAMICHRSADFIATGWFGPGTTHPRLHSRVGDFVLQMRGDWTIKDWLAGEQRYEQAGVHAGASAAEMWVPLVAVR